MEFKSHKDKEYIDYLESIKDRLPPAAYEFATAHWHYDHEDPRYLHDNWVESIVVEETKEDPAVSTRYDAQFRQLQITVRLVSRWHEGYATLSFKNVYGYHLDKFPVEDPENLWANEGHHDLLTDEIRLSERGKMIHEAEFRMGRWPIECDDMIYNWQPKNE